MVFFGVSLTQAAHSNSSLISELLNCLVIAIQHKLFVETVSFLLSNDGIKLLFSNIVLMYIPLGPFFTSFKKLIGQYIFTNAMFTRIRNKDPFIKI